MKYFLLVVFSFLIVNTQAAIIYVNKAATGLNNGSSWVNAYTDLETAMLFAMSGDELWVAKGTYYTSSTNDRTSTFALGNGVKLYGNFAGTETNINQRVGLTPDASGSDRINETILSGDLGVLNDSTDNAHRIMYIVGNTLPIIIDGVKIVKGNAILSVAKGKGAGIYIENAGSVTLRNLIIANNTGTAGLDGKGGGLYVNNATSLLIENSAIINNRIIDDLTVSGNAIYNGGGVYINCPLNQVLNSYIENNRIQSNRSNSEGGGLYLTGCLTLDISNSTIKNNSIAATTSAATKYLYGGGLTCYGNSTSATNLVNTNISSNSISTSRAYTYGGGCYLSIDTLEISGCIINNNQINNSTSGVVVSNQGGGMHAMIGKKTRMTNTTFNANAIRGRYGHGGGLYLVSSATDTALVQHCQFADNLLESNGFYDGTLAGGGLYTGLKVKYTDCRINHNSALLSSTATSAYSNGNSNVYGGGMAAFTYSWFTGCSIDSNITESYALYNVNNYMTFPTITARTYGGGIYSTAKIELFGTSVDYNQASSSISSVYIWSSYFKGYTFGGGVYNEFATSGQKSLISNCSIRHNSAQAYSSYAYSEMKGGGIYTKNMDIFNSDISHNETYVSLSVSGGLNQGGGIYHEGKGKSYFNIISCNNASAGTSYMSGGYTTNTYGGGLYSNSVDSVSNCLIFRNSVTARSKAYGGGIYNANTARFSNLTIAKNHTYSELSDRNGSGIYTNSSAAQIHNCIIYFNDLLSYYDQTTSSAVKNSIIELYPNGATNFNINPQFTDTTANNYHVSPASIAIDRGDITYIPADVSVDLEGNSRISGISVDIGTYEFDPCKSYTTLYHTICQGTPYVFNGQNLTVSGTYKDTLTNIAACDSIITLHLTVSMPTPGIATISACESYTWIDGITYTASNNTATYTLTNAAGCDSVVTLNLTIKQPNTGIATVSACGSYTWINGITYTSSNNTATYTLTNAAGCDSVVTLHLTIKQPSTGIATVSACGSYTWINGVTYTTSNNTATYTLINAAGCDSVVTLHLTIKQPTTGIATVSACGSYTWINGVTYTSSNNTATYTLINAAGCDSVVTLHLTIKQPSTGIATVSACNSYTWINGVTYTSSNNTATYTLTNAAGCDSVVTLHLTIKQPNTGIATVSACGSYTWINGVTYTSSNNTATHTLTNAAGCDSVVTLHLTIKQPTTGIATVSACGSYTWINGITYTSSNNTATHTLTNAAGCDSVVTLHLTIKQPTTGIATVSACDSYTWINGVTYTTSNNTATYTLTNAAGCDSVVTLHLTIKQPSTGIATVSACGSYTWINGVTYTSSNNTATYTLTNAAGCDSVVTLHLTIKQPTTGIATVSACGSYTWINGITYTSSNNTATYTLTNAAGCDSVVTLHLTIKQLSTGIATVSACGSYTWINGVTYTSSNNTATHTLTNAAGCDSVVTLHLTIKQPTTEIATVSACGSYTWINGITYTASNNTATYTLTNAAGCDSVVTLHLTIKQPSTGIATVSACGSYTWINGITYTSSNNTATYTLTNAAGCDSVVTLHLTIKQPTTGIATVSACGSYTWINGITYTSSNNTATHTLTNAAGCDSVVTLHLTIKQPTTGIATVSACGSYTWINGVTYTSSNNTATYTLTNAAGCDSVVTLHLTIKQPTTGIATVSACDSYTWINGVTYTTSNNTATYTLTNAAGCDSVVTLHLTIKQPSTGIASVSACGSYTWIDGITYTASNNTATYTLTNAAGCDSVVTLNLTIQTINTTVLWDGTTLTSDTPGAAYQWIDCNTGNPVSGETNQNFSPTVDGDYAVIITLGECSDTSNCVNAIITNVNTSSALPKINIYPNPNNGRFTITAFTTSTVEITDALGRVILSAVLPEGNNVIQIGNVVSGLYNVKIVSGNRIRTEKMIISQ